ncbi:beta-ketoacyl-[acyl-carrier-protein] synthase family protein [Candidatus Magnetomonas plexicatena]|uniref:beta-ketoacyl-[acyl-carrier-protein] synthase family protein n=1 Tax=Candidatus Magnetomonas plexicatena TaxID=2552947 RepID=UPI001C76DCE9|nr:beta-ketoacyl-[acyl-carrier-protein] synthase family protein [Nitrospirales bacterium LBB_01]
MTRVVITGIGAVTPIGSTFCESWGNLLNGVSGITLHHDDFTGIVNAAGKLKKFSPSAYLTDKDVLRLDPFIHYALASAAMALKDAGLSDNIDDGYFENCGVVIGSSRGGITSLDNAMSKLYSGSAKKLSAYLMAKTTVSMAASCISEKFKMAGRTLGISNACSSGATAIGEAFRLVRHGYSDIVLAGGTEAPLCRLCFMGYGASGALSKSSTPNASRPFDKTRDGFVLSEGAAVMVIESYERAAARRAYMYAEIIGYGNVSDAFHIVKPNPAGEVKAMEAAIKDANITAHDIDFINAHATGTREGDHAESLAINKVFGKAIPVTANKSMTGHMLGASGAFETAVTAMTLSKGILPPTINVKEQDESCPVSLTGSQLKGSFRCGLTNSFGFGGVNTVLVLSSVD